MWRKPTDGKPSSQDSNAPVPVANPVTPVPAPPVPAVPAASKPVSAEKPPVAPGTPAPVAPPAQPVAARDRGAASVITSGLKIRGEVSGNADLVIDGELQGKISLTASKVIVGPSGRVQADIEAAEIVIEGSLQGNLKARDSLRLAASSRVEGSVLTPRVAIADGARLRGKVEMLRAPETRNASVALQLTTATNETPDALHAPAK